MYYKNEYNYSCFREDNTEHLPPFNYNQSADNRMSSNLMSESGMPSNNDYPKQLSGMPSNGATSIVVNLPSGMLYSTHHVSSVLFMIYTVFISHPCIMLGKYTLNTNITIANSIS